MMETGKEIFSRAMIDAYAEKYREGLASSASESGEFSRAHARRISSILGSKIKYVPDKRTRFKRAVAVALIAAALLLAGCAAVVYRDKIGDFFTAVYETYIKGSFSEEEATNNEVIEEYYTLSYVPEGYWLVDDKPGIAVAVSVWENQEGNQLILEQTNIDSGRYFIDNESGQSDVIETEEYTVYFRNIDGTYRCIWSNEKYAFRFYFEKELSTEEIIKIIEGISPKQSN